ncbi:MAG TPA: ABC transporter permease, partial [Terriglobales bacterium]|nr:ABC transporter permease [Terriglobales bacterium]
MRNTWLVIRREYLERVRSKSFIVSTILLPAFVFAITVLPTKLMMMKSNNVFHLMVVTSTKPVADAVKAQLQSTDSDRKYQIDELITDDNTNREKLAAEVKAKKIDGYLWLTDESIADNKAAFSALSTSDFALNQNIREAASKGVTHARLAQHGVAASEVDTLLKPVHVETVALAGKKGGEVAQFFASFLVAMMIYITLIMYGMSVMRSVLEEKSSRVM